MATRFSEETFKYFERAKRNRFKKHWFEKNKNLYLDAVREPFSYLVDQIREELYDELPRIDIDPKKITRPLRPSNRAEENGFIKHHSHITLWEKKTSLFEWNPAIHIQIGGEKDDNLYGIGLYMVSSRQMSRLRHELYEDFDEIDAILSETKLKRAFGGLAGERYKRFPKGYDAEDEKCKYHWHKRFFLDRSLTREEVKKPGFAKKVVKDLKTAMPFFQWVRNAVGVYKK